MMSLFPISTRQAPNLPNIYRVWSPPQRQPRQPSFERLEMPLNASSPLYLHVLQNVSLVALSLFCIPLCTFITLCSQFASPYTTASKHIQRNQKWRASSSSTSRRRVVLVTGVGMSKGLSIARAFYKEGHIVIGADFEPWGIPVCGRFSTSLRKFYRLTKPALGSKGSNAYVEGLLHIIKEQKVELWVSCSGVASAMDDADAAEAIEKLSNCKAIQFGAEVTEVLHEKHTFIQRAWQFGLNVPETHLITSIDTAMVILHGEKVQIEGRKFIMKSIGLDDAVRADMTLLPCTSVEKSRSHLTRLAPSVSRPFVLQQFVNGAEYCTHSVIIRGRVVAFTACPSAELLMHYKALDPVSEISLAMQKYTTLYAQKLGDVTGHFSIDFMFAREDLGSDMMKRLYPIECNPRAHTAVVLFEHDSERMTEAYLSVLEEEKEGIKDKQRVALSSNTTGYYWIGHDIVAHGLLPILSVFTSKGGILGLAARWRKVLLHIITWKDGAYQIWDPWPFWWLYSVYWPGMFLTAIMTKSWWSRSNVSTTKIFRC